MTQTAYNDDDELPFAITMEQNWPQHLLLVEQQKQTIFPDGEPNVENRTMRSRTVTFKHPETPRRNITTMGYPLPPELVKSVGSDEDQSQTTMTSIESPAAWSGSSQTHNNNNNGFAGESSAFSIDDSVPSIVPTLGGSSHLPHSAEFFYNQDDLYRSTIPTEINTDNQCMLISSINNTNMGSWKMPVVYEEDGDEDDSQSNSVSSSSTNGVEIASRREGTLIVSAGPDNEDWISIEEEPTSSTWKPSAPLLPLPRRSLNFAIARACLRVKSLVIDDNTFEVSVTLDPPSTQDDVLRVVGNPNMLQAWLEPVPSLVVTTISGDGVGYDSFSTAGAASIDTQGREYEGKWIEAVIPMGVRVPSPGNHASGYWNAAKHAMLHTLGVPSSGKLSMFVERHRRQASFTLGPFPGNIFASHSLSTYEDKNGHACVVDRVRLKHGEEDDLSASTSSSHVWGSFKRCWLPSVSDYMEQTSLSMARLCVLTSEEIGA